MAHLGLIICASALMAAGNTLIKVGLGKIGLHSLGFSYIIKNILAVVTQPYTLLGIVSFAAGFLVWLRVLSEGGLSKSYPIYVGIFTVLIALSSVFILKETISVARIIGILIIIFGIVVVSRTL